MPSLIVYEGPSIIDGAPIVVVLTSSSENSKTGDLVQSWVMRADVAPTVAVKTGDDASVCGMCPHRPILARATGDAPCYVNLGHAPLAIFGAYQRGSYQRARTVADVAQFLQGRKLRIGSYGDPYAAPVGLWRAMVSLSAGHVGYTHQWQSVGFDVSAWSPLVMASADSEDEARQATALGMRYFRVSIGVQKQALEVTCPASEEGGRKVQCADCMLCAGTSKQARSIVIADHGPGHKSRVINIRSI